MTRRSPFPSWPVSATRLVLAAAAGLFVAAPSAAQQQPLPIVSPPPGVYVEPDGTVKRREVDAKADLALMRARAKAALDSAKDPRRAYVSLPRAFAAARAATEAGRPIPDDARYLGGLTRVDFVFVYPPGTGGSGEGGANGDLVIAGPAEPVHAADPTHAVGKRTGRPVMRLEDLAVAMRIVARLRGGEAFGCRLDPDPAAPARIAAAMQRLAKGSRADRVAGVRDATGPQVVSLFGGIPPDSRFGLAAVAADYELKRYGLGLARSTVPDLGTIVDNSRPAVNKVWFELAYEPVLVSPAGDAYGLRGPRLKVQAGAFDWDTKGATPKAFEFARRMTQNVEALATSQPLVADLQNLADLSIVAALVKRDGLDRRAGWDAAWVLGDSAGGFPVARVTVPKVADALVNYTNGAIAAGGVMLSPAKALSAPAERDATGALAGPRRQGAEALAKTGAGAAAVVQP